MKPPPQKMWSRRPLRNGAYEDDFSRDAPLVFIAGPIKHWWSCWGSPEHLRYARWRHQVREALVEAGYLTYAPWEAFKGTWNRKAQAVNDAALATADVVLVLRVPGIPALGTAAELQYARRVGVPTQAAWPAEPLSDTLRLVRDAAGPGVQP